MVDTLSNILNWLIPIGIIIWAMYLIRNPLGNFFFWMKNLFGMGVNRIKEADVPSLPHNFAGDGNITYR